MEVGLLFTGSYFMVLASWTVIQVTKKFHHSRLKHLEYHNTVTFPCCRSCHKLPVESIIKLVTCLLFVAFELASSTNFGKASKIVNYKDLNFATIFGFFILCSIIDIITEVKGKLFIDDLDYAFLALTFAIQGLLHDSHQPDKSSTEWTLYNLLMMSSFSCCFATLFEMKYRDKVYCPLLRGYCLMVLGSWSLHVTVILLDPVGHSISSDRVLQLSMYFTWHCAIDSFICLSLYLLTLKMYNKNKCFCLPVDYNAASDTVYLENRIRFDYHMLDRLESDLD